MAQEPKTDPIRAREPDELPVSRTVSEEGLVTDPLGQQAGIHWDPVQSFTSGVAGILPGMRVGHPLYGGLAGFSAGFAADVAGQIVANQTRGLPWWLGLPAELIAAIKAGKWGAQLVPKRLLTPRSAPTAPEPPSPVARPQPRTSYSPTPTEEHAVLHPLREAAGSTIPAGPRRTFTVGPGGQLVETSPRVPGSTVNVVEGQWPNIVQRKRDIPTRAQSIVEGQWPPRLTQPITAESLANRLLREQRLRVPGAPPTIREIVAQAVEAAAKPAKKGKAPKTAVKPAAPPAPVTPAVSQAVIDAALRTGKEGLLERLVDWTRVRAEGAGQAMSWAGSPILSQIERVAGPVIGRQLVAREGWKSQRQGQIWQDLFGDLTRSLRKLPKKLYANFIDSLEGRATPLNQTVADKVADFNRVFGDQGTALLAQQQAGLKVNPLRQYFMHEFDPAVRQALIADSKRRSQVIQDMVASGVAVDEKEAKVLLKKYLANPNRSLFRDFRTGAEYKRSKNVPFYIQDPVRAVTLRGRNIAQRLAELEVYGANKEHLRSLTNQLDPEAMTRTNRLMELTRRRDPVEEGLNKLAQTAMSFNALTSLSLSFIMNMSQPSLLLLRTSLPNLAKASLRFAANPRESVRRAKQLGVYADMAQRLLHQEMTGGVVNTLGRGALAGFNVSERFVRAIAAEAGVDWARTIQARLADPRQTKLNTQWLTKELTKLNFVDESLQRVLTTKTLTSEDVKLIAWSIADQTSFLPRTARKSEFYLTNGMGPVILQFKSFLMNTGRLLKQTIFDEWRAGNRKPALKAVGLVFPAMAVIGEPFADLNALVRGSDRPPVSLEDPSSFAWRAVDNVSQMGALGLGLGLIQEMTGLRPDNYGGARTALSFFLGPSVTSAIEEPTKAVSALRARTGDYDEDEVARRDYEVLRRLVRRTPYLGAPLTNYVLPSSGRPEEQEDYNLWDRLGFTRKAWEDYDMRRLDARMRSR